MERTRRWTERSPFRSNLIIIVMGLFYLQLCVESASRMQNSKPIFNEITPSPEFSISTDGWRPIMPPSTIAPPKTEEGMRVEDHLPKKTKNDVGPNRFPEESRPITLEDLSPPPIDIIADSQQAGDNESQMRLRRNKKRPPFKTVEPPVIVSSGSEALAFRVNTEPHFVRHFSELQDPQFRHRPVETNSGAIYRAVPLLDPAPSQEMLPPTAPSRPFPPLPEGQHFRLRPQQASFIAPHIIFHGQLPIAAQQQQQQRYPAVARPAEPLPGSLLRPHGDRAPLTDSTAFRIGGVGFHHRPAPVQWQNPLMEGRPSFTVTSTPLVDDNPWPSIAHHGGVRRPEMNGATNFPHNNEPQRIRGSNEGKPHKDDPQMVATTVLIPDIPKNPFLSATSAKTKGKPQREPVNSQFHSQNSGEQERIVLIGHSVKHHNPSNPSLRDPIINHRPNKPTAVESGLPSRGTKKPFRENNEGKPFDQGFGSSESQEMMSHKENVRPEPVMPEPQRDERPRGPGHSKYRQHSNYRKRPEEVTTESNTQAERFMPETTPKREKVIPTSEGVTSQRGQGFRVRKRRPKPKPQRQESHFNKPTEIQEEQQTQQDSYQPQTHQQQVFHQQIDHQNDQQEQNQYIVQQQQQGFHQQDFIQQQEISQPSSAVSQPQEENPQQQNIPQQQEEPHQQPQEVHQQRKRPRRPTRIRKPIKESQTEAPIQKEENHLLPSGPAAVQEEEQPQRHKFREPRPRPGLRIRRPRPEVSTSPLPIQNSATAPDENSYAKDELPIERPKKVRIRLPPRQENKEIYDDKENDQFPSSAIGGPTGPYFAQNQEIRTPEKFQNPIENEQVFQEDGFRGMQEIPPSQLGGDGIVIPEDDVKVIEITTENAGVIEDVTQTVNIIEVPQTPAISEQETSTTSTTSEAPVLFTTETQTTTVVPTSSAYGIRSRLRTGSRPRFSVKDYRERLNRLSQLSGRAKNNTDSSSETEDAGTTGSGVGPTAPSRERWYPGRRQQQTLQEQQQLQHQRLQANRNDGEASTERGKLESRDRYRPRAPALRPRPVTEDVKKSAESKGKVENTSTTASSRYRNRFGGRYSTTTQSGSETDITTTESPTSRRRGILTTYGMRRPYPLKLRSGAATTTEATDVQAETTPMTPSPDVTTTTVPATTETPTTTTTTAATTTTTTAATTEINVPTIVENEVTERVSHLEAASKVGEFNAPTTQVIEVLELQHEMMHQDELMKIRKNTPLIESVEESEEAEDDGISPEQRVSDLTLWATTGNNGGVRNQGPNNAGLVTFSAVPYPSSAFSSRFVTMATEDPVLPLEAFFFGPPSSSIRSKN